MKLDHGRKVRACTFLDVGGKASAVSALGGWGSQAATKAGAGPLLDADGG